MHAKGQDESFPEEAKSSNELQWQQTAQWTKHEKQPTEVEQQRACLLHSWVFPVLLVSPMEIRVGTMAV